MLLQERDVNLIHTKSVFLKRYFPQNTIRKNYFLAACAHIYPQVDLEFVNDTCPYGGIIGIGNSRMDVILNKFKLFRLHAVLHDASGYMKSYNGMGPGYSYIIPCPSIFNSCLIGHVSGLAYCIYLKCFHSDTYSLLDC